LSTVAGAAADKPSACPPYSINQRAKQLQAPFFVHTLLRPEVEK
jgi:hypothetical protein